MNFGQLMYNIHRSFPFILHFLEAKVSFDRLELCERKLKKTKTKQGTVQVVRSGATTVHMEVGIKPTTNGSQQQLRKHLNSAVTTPSR